MNAEGQYHASECCTNGSLMRKKNLKHPFTQINPKLSRRRTPFESHILIFINSIMNMKLRDILECTYFNPKHKVFLNLTK